MSCIPPKNVSSPVSGSGTEIAGSPAKEAGTVMTSFANIAVLLPVLVLLSLPSSPLSSGGEERTVGINKTSTWFYNTEDICSASAERSFAAAS